MDGVLVVDKPAGKSSHELVAVARRALRTRTVGHTGTLDPMATGVLVLVIGQGTKLASYLMAEDKEYEAVISLGEETDTLDADGRVTAQGAAITDFSAEDIRRAAQPLLGITRQRAPLISAIKKDGVPLYRRARRGETLEAPEREVTLHDLKLVDVQPTEIRVRLRCSSGYYVRSFARDLALALGTRGHLSYLRRLRNGSFDLEAAVTAHELELARKDDDVLHSIRSRTRPLEEICRALPHGALTEHGLIYARHGRPIEPADVVGMTASSNDSPVALLDPEGRLAVIARFENGKYRVMRGFPSST